MKLHTEHCQGCGKVMNVGEALVGFLLWCEDCPFPREPCETCGKVECDGECCMCQYCVERRARALNFGQRLSVKVNMMFEQIVEMTRKTTDNLKISAENLLLRLVFGPPPPKRPTIPDNFGVGTGFVLPKREPTFIPAKDGEIPEPDEDQKWQTKDRRRTSIPFLINYVSETHATTDAGYNIKIERLKKHYRYLGKLV